MQKERVYCEKCDIEMRLQILQSYEYIDGIKLQNVSQYLCPKCKRTFFTDAQVEEMERLSTRISKSMFGFKRKVGTSGRCLVINLPDDLVGYADVSKGQEVLIKPVDRHRFIIEIS